jgi:hypothetical protein
VVRGHGFGCFLGDSHHLAPVEGKPTGEVSPIQNHLFYTIPFLIFFKAML